MESGTRSLVPTPNEEDMGKVVVFGARVNAASTCAVRATFSGEVDWT